MIRDISQVGGTGYYRYNRDVIINNYNIINYGMIGLDISRYFYEDGDALSCVYYDLDGNMEKLRYIIARDFTLYKIGFYL